MSNALYDKGRNSFARGEILWKAAGGSTIRAFLIDSAVYTANLATDQFLSDVPAGSRKGNSGLTGRTDGVQLTLSDPSAGVCDASDAILTAVTAGGSYEYVLIYVDDGVAEASSRLIALLDTATGLPITPNGADINLVWSNLSDKIFKL